MSIKDTFPDIKPTLLLDFANTKTLDPRITFGRASTATYYDGKTVAKAEENLFSPSVNIGTPYQNAANALTNNVGTAPDGSPTASLLVPTSAAVRHYCSSPLGAPAQAGATMTASVHVRSAGYGFAFLMLAGSTSSGGSRYGVTVNLSTGAVGGYSAASNVSGQSAAVSDLGGGWYRVALTATLSVAAVQPVVYVQSMPTDGTAYGNGGDFLPAYSGNGVDGAYFWGFQLEQRTTVTAYTPTTSATITNYIPQLMTAPAGGPRFDHNPVTRESLGLLIEEARTNLLLRSEAIDVSAIWAKAGSTIAADASIAPDGALTAKAIVRTTSNNESMVRQSTAQAASTTYTFSVYAKSGSTGALLYLRNIAVDATTGTGVVTFSLDGTNTITANSTYTGKASITPVGNGWYRCSITGTTAATIANNLVDAGCSTNAGLLSGSINASVFIWGAQLEAGAFATSYIPTTTSTVTRQADSASMTGANFSSWYRADEGTFYADVKSQSSGACVEANNGASSDRVAVSFDAANSRMAGVNAISGVYTAIVYSLAGTTPNSASNKGAFAYKENDFALSANASAVSTDTNGQVGKPNQVRLGSSGLGATGEFINGSIRKLAFYPKRLTNPQLQALTA
jgi:hypothetical protein